MYEEIEKRWEGRKFVKARWRDRNMKRDNVMVFSRVHATLHPALSVGLSVGLSVTFYFFY